MGETLRWDFVGNDRLSDVLEKIDRTLDKVDRSLGDFGRRAKTTAADTKIIEAEIVDLGDKAERTDTKLKKVFRGLPAEIAAAKVAIKSLQTEFAKTGDESLLQKITEQRSKLGKLESVSKGLFGNVVGEAEKAAVPAGSSFADKFVDTLNNSLPSEVRTILLIGVGTAAVAVAPLIAGAISGAVLGGVGLGGVVGGVVLAAQDSRVKGAFSTMGQQILSALKDAATPFVEPLLRVPRLLKDEFGAALPDLRGIFGDLAGTIEPLAKGLGGMIREALPGIRSAVTASVPLIQSLARAMPEIGRTLSKFFDAMANSGPGAEKALLVVIRLIEGIILGVGYLIEALTKVFDMLALLPGPFQNLARQAADIGHSTSDSFNLISTSAEQATDRLRRFSDAYDSALNLNTDAQHAAIAYQRAIQELTDTLAKGQRTLALYTKTGQDHREAVLAVIEAAERERQANIANGDSVEAANAKYQAHIKWLRNTLEQMHYNKAEIDELIGSVERLPLDINMTVSLNGQAGVLNSINGIGDAINRVAGLGVGGVSIGAIAGVGGKRKRALGGAVMPGQVYQVGEQRTEYFEPAMPGRITSSPPGATPPDETYLAPVSITMEGERVWSGLLAYKRRSGKVSLGLA